MILWTIAVLLFAGYGFAGFSLGAIRLGVSLIGLLLASVLAIPLGHLIAPLIGNFGIKNPVTLWLVGPFVVFVIIVIIANVCSQLVHQKVEVYYKYKAGELRMNLWKRVNSGTGIGVGLANAAIYLILISWVVYVFGYWTTQVATGDGVGFSARMLNSAAQTLQSSGMIKVAAAIDRMPDNYYQTADVAGLIYHNDLLEGRLASYPAFLSLGEQREFQDIGNDKEFMEKRQSQPPIGDILDNPKIQAILANTDLLHQIWGVITPNLTDLQEYLKTGKSAKYDGEPLLGRWDFDLNGTLNAIKRLRPNIVLTDMQRAKAIIMLSYPKTTLLATPEPEKIAALKEAGKLRASTNPKAAPQVDFQNFRGSWSGDGSKYQLTFPEKTYEGVVDADKLTLTGDAYPLVFQKE